VNPQTTRVDLSFTAWYDQNTPMVANLGEGKTGRVKDKGAGPGVRGVPWDGTEGGGCENGQRGGRANGKKREGKT